MKTCQIKLPTKDTKYEHENSQLMQNMIDMMFSDGKKTNVPKSFELILYGKCNLGCKYCYMHNFKNELYPSFLENDEVILKNAKRFMDYYHKIESNLNIDLFSGELFGTSLGFEVLEMIVNSFKDRPNTGTCIVIPTNFTFIHNEELVNRVEAVFCKAKSYGIVVHLSSSFDGKYMEDNRPYIKNIGYDLNKVRDDAYYDKVFEFIKKWGSGVHPMVYSEGIEKWKDNFNWFQDMFEKHGISWTKIFLLHVRNEEWTKDQIQDMQEFISWLFDWVYDKFDGNKEDIVQFLIAEKTRGFNILGGNNGGISRGLSCSIQNTLAIRLGDMKIVPCHRQMREGFNYGTMNISDDLEVTYDPENLEMMIAIYSMHHRSQPYCEVCDINALCSGGCQGSQFESMGDPFVPIPTVCKLHHAMAITTVESWLRLGIYPRMLSYCTDEQINQNENIRRFIENGKYE